MNYELGKIKSISRLSLRLPTEASAKEGGYSRGNPFFWIPACRQAGLRALAMTAVAVFIAFLPFTVQASGLVKTPNNLGLVYYASMEEGKGATVTDFSGKGNIGTLTNMDPATDWVTGKIGKALDFDGTDDYISIADSTSLNPTTAYTVTGWVKFDSLASQYGILVMKVASDYQYRIYRDRTYFSVDAGAGAAITVDSIISVNTWYHFAEVYDGSGSGNTGRLKLYVNGVNQNLGTYAGTTVPASITTGTNPVYLGSHVGVSLFHDGSIDEVRIYNRALSATEVAALYAKTSQALIKNSSRGLVAHWTFEEGTGTATVDKTGNGNTGTLTNGPTWTGGKFGKGIGFDGADDYVAVPNLGFSGSARQFSVCMWYNPSTGSTLRTLFSMGGDGTNSSANSLEILRDYPSANDLSMYGNGQAVRLTANSTPAVNQWTHACFSSDGTTTKIYTNGTQAASTAFSWTINNNTYAIGADLAQGGVAYNWYGSIDDVRIYNRALSAQEVSNLYNSSGEALGILNRAHRDTLTSGLVGYWSFDGPTMTTATSSDSSGQGNHGTLTNGPTKTIGVLGQAMKFDGTDDYVLASGSTGISGDVAVTAAMWVKPTNITTPWIVFNMRGGSKYFGIFLNVLGNGEVGLEGGYCGAETAAGALVANVWQHVAVVKSPGEISANTAIYVNGVSKSVSAGPYGTCTPTYGSGPVSIGGGWGSYTEYPYTGSIDEVRVYNRALSVSEVLQLYAQGK